MSEQSDHQTMGPSEGETAPLRHRWQDAMDMALRLSLGHVNNGWSPARQPLRAWDLGTVLNASPGLLLFGAFEVMDRAAVVDAMMASMERWARAQQAAAMVSGKWRPIVVMMRRCQADGALQIETWVLRTMERWGFVRDVRFVPGTGTTWRLTDLGGDVALLLEQEMGRARGIQEEES